MWRSVKLNSRHRTFRTGSQNYRRESSVCKISIVVQVRCKSVFEVKNRFWWSEGEGGCRGMQGGKPLLRPQDVSLDHTHFNWLFLPMKLLDILFCRFWMRWSLTGVLRPILQTWIYIAMIITSHRYKETVITAIIFIPSLWFSQV